MRIWLVVLLMLPLLPVVGAQSEGELGTDPSGDVASGAGIPVPPGFDEIDLRAFGVREDPTGFDLDVTLNAFPREAAAGIVLGLYEVTFEHNGKEFRASASRSNLAGTTDMIGSFWEYDPGRDAYNYMGQLAVEPDYAAGRFTITVPREQVRDDNGTVPAPGRSLEAFAVQAYANQIITTGSTPITEADGVYWRDALPDQGVLERAHDVIYGVKSTGHLRLSSDEPFRASNGEATTFVFHVMAENQGTEDTVRFGATGFPTGWDVTLPPDMRLGANAKAEVAVVVRTAFAHSHGSTNSFVLSMTSAQDPGAVGRIEIGVHYPAIPQPAGHHDRLWIHSFDHTDNVAFYALATALGTALSQTGMLQDMYLNAVEEDDRADEVPAEGRKCQLIALDPDYPVGTGYCWDLPLNPGLQLGLDFDLARVGSISASITARAPMLEASLEGELVHLGPTDPQAGPFASREETLLATINRTAPIDLLLGESAVFEAPIVPTREADYIEYQRGASIELRLQLNTLRPDTWLYGPPIPAPVLHSGGEIQLPLNEYADPVVGVVDLGVKGIRVSAIGEQERFVNPGRTVVFKAQVENQGNATDVALELIGSHRDWVQLLAPAEFRVTPGATRDVAISVTPPRGTLDGETADLVLQVSNLEDITQRSLIRFVAHVDTEGDWPDEAHLAGEYMQSTEKGAPGFSVLALLAAVAVALRRR